MGRRYNLHLDAGRMDVFIDGYRPVFEEIVGWSIDKRMTKELVIKSFKQAKEMRKPEPGLIFHSDRGSQYASDEFKELLDSSKAVQSMSRKGNCWDNAVAESFF